MSHNGGGEPGVSINGSYCSLLYYDVFEPPLLIWHMNGYILKCEFESEIETRKLKKKGRSLWH